MLKLSDVKKMNENMSKKYSKKDLTEAIKFIVLNYIEEEATDRMIEECDIYFDCDIFQRDLDIDTIVSKIQGIVEENITNSIDEVADYKNIQLGDE